MAMVLMLACGCAGYLICFALNVITSISPFSKHSPFAKQISILAAQRTASKLNKWGVEQIARQTLHKAQPPHPNWPDMTKVSNVQMIFNLN